MNGLINWRAIEKMTGWATQTTEDDAKRWDDGADGWNKRNTFERDFTARQVGALTRITADDTVLDACCGAGRLTIPLARIAKSVTGLDSGERMLRHCARNAAEAGLPNVTTLLRDWHKSVPGIDFPRHDVVVACISPAQADIVKLSSAATRYCYSLSFSTPIAYRHVMADLFDGVIDKWNVLAKNDHSKQGLGLNVPFNILFDLGAKPTVNYVDGGWEYEGDTAEDIYAFLRTLDDVAPEKEERFRANVDKRTITKPNGRLRYVTKTQMYVLGWDPNELKSD